MEEKDILDEADALCGRKRALYEHANDPCRADGAYVELIAVRSEMIDILPAVLAEARRLEAEVKRLEGMWDKQQALIADLSKGTDDGAISDLMGQLEKYKADCARWKKIAEHERAKNNYYERAIKIQKESDWARFREIATFDSVLESSRLEWKQAAARELETEHSNHIVGPDQIVEASACEKLQKRVDYWQGVAIKYRNLIPALELGEGPYIELPPERRKAIESILKWLKDEWDEGREYPTISDEEKILRSMLEEAGE
jgi:hypothetical protein